MYQKDGEDIAECNACGYTSVRPKDVEPVQEQAVDDTGVVKFVK